MTDTLDGFAPLVAIQPLLAELAARAAEMEEARRLPADLARQMAETGVFRMVTPKRFGGFEASPRQIVGTVEAIAAVNASAGWCTMIAATTALNAAYMAPEAAAGIYTDPLTITGGVFAPMGKAIVEGDLPGFRTLAVGVGFGELQLALRRMHGVGKWRDEASCRRRARDADDGVSRQ